MVYRFKVEVCAGPGAWQTFIVETTAGNEKAAREQVEHLIGLPIEKLELRAFYDTKDLNPVSY